MHETTQQRLVRMFQEAGTVDWGSAYLGGPKPPDHIHVAFDGALKPSEWGFQPRPKSPHVHTHQSGTIVFDETNAFKEAPMNRNDAIHSRLAALEAELAERERYGSDDYAEGAVLTFKGDFGTEGGTKYAYAAIKAAGRWHLTGGKAVQNATWDDLVDFLIKANVRKVRLSTASERVA